MKKTHIILAIVCLLQACSSGGYHKGDKVAIVSNNKLSGGICTGTIVDKDGNNKYKVNFTNCQDMNVYGVRNNVDASILLAPTKAEAIAKSQQQLGETLQALKKIPGNIPFGYKTTLTDARIKALEKAVSTNNLNVSQSYINLQAQFIPWVSISPENDGNSSVAKLSQMANTLTKIEPSIEAALTKFAADPKNRSYIDNVSSGINSLVSTSSYYHGGGKAWFDSKQKLYGSYYKLLQAAKNAGLQTRQIQEPKYYKIALIKGIMASGSLPNANAAMAADAYKGLSLTIAKSDFHKKWSNSKEFAFLEGDFWKNIEKPRYNNRINKIMPIISEFKSNLEGKRWLFDSHTDSGKSHTYKVRFAYDKTHGFRMMLDNGNKSWPMNVSMTMFGTPYLEFSKSNSNNTNALGSVYTNGGINLEGQTLVSWGDGSGGGGTISLAR